MMIGNNLKKEDNMKSLKALRLSRKILMLTGTILILSYGSGLAQDAATGTATATVQTIITVTATQSLIFGNVFQGVAKTVASNVDAESGIFTITGQAGAGANLQMTLPEYMALADGSDRMPLSFSTTDANVDTSGATPSTFVGANGWINQDPRVLPAGAVIGTAGTQIYLGGRVTPTADQTAGAYTGEIVLMVAYDGT
jgi:hypothetical protein